MGLRINHISASYGPAGQVPLANGQGVLAVGMSGSMVFDPSKLAAPRPPADIFSENPDAAYIFSGTMDGNDKSLFIGDVVVSGSLILGGQTNFVDSTALDSDAGKVAVYQDKNTITAGARIFQDDYAAFTHSSSRMQVGVTSSLGSAVFAVRPDSEGNDPVAGLSTALKLGLSSSAMTEIAGANNVTVGSNTSVMIANSTGGVMLTVDANDVKVKQGAGLVLSTDSAEKVESNGTNLRLDSGADIDLVATADVNLPSDVGLVFGDDGEKIEGDGSKLSIAASQVDFNIEGNGDILIPANVGLILDGVGAEKIESDGTDINFAVGAAGDVNLPADIGLTFGDDGEKIEGNGTKLVIASSEDIDLTATGDVNLPADVGLVFGDDGEKIEGNGTNLSIVSSGELDITATQVDIAGGLDATGAVGLGASGGSADTTVRGDLSVGENLTVAGNLVVNGATTTIDSENSTLEDRIIAIASGSAPADVDSGFVFTRSSANLGGGSDKKNGALLFDGGTGNAFKLGVTNDTGESSTLTVADDDLADLSVGKLLVDGSANHVDVLSNVLTLTAGTSFEVASVGDIVLDTDGDVVIDGTGQKLEFGAANSGEHITSDGTDLTLASGADINLTATADVNLPAQVGLTLGGDTEKLEADASKNVTLAADGDISLTPTATHDVKIPASIGLVFGDGEKIEGNDTDLSIFSGGDINLTATADVNLPHSTGLTFGQDGAKIEANAGGAIVIHTVGDLSLTPAADKDVNVPANIGMTFGNDGEKIEGDGSKLTIAAANLDITLEAGGDVVLPSQIGIVFGDSGEKIEGDGTDLEIASSGNVNFAVSGVIAPTNDNAVDLGAFDKRFANIYTGDLNLRNDRGDWTLIEENDFISFRNNTTGRRFRMVMEDITGTGTYGPGNDGEM